MHGLGNDYIYINTDLYPIPDLPSFSLKYSDRRTGIGGDGVVTYSFDKEAQCYRMRIFNIDGSEGLMCGNAIRCVAKLLYERGFVHEEVIDIVTGSGVKTIWMTIDRGTNKVTHARVDMSAPKLLSPSLDVVSESGSSYEGVHVSMGNPHFVTFLETPVASFPLESEGSMVESHPTFLPDRVNFEIAHVLSPKEIQMRVYERGSGITQACGTGACGTAVAAIHRNLVTSPVDVHMPGGTLTIEWDGDFGSPVYMTGPATHVFEGSLEIE